MAEDSSMLWILPINWIQTTEYVSKNVHRMFHGLFCVSIMNNHDSLWKPKHISAGHCYQNSWLKWEGKMITVCTWVVIYATRWRLWSLDEGALTYNSLPPVLWRFWIHITSLHKVYLPKDATLLVNKTVLYPKRYAQELISVKLIVQLPGFRSVQIVNLWIRNHVKVRMCWVLPGRPQRLMG